MDMDRQTFAAAVKPVTDAIADRAVDQDLSHYLNQQFPLDSPVVATLRQACLDGVESGLLCKHEAGGIRYGRVLRPDKSLGCFSVDVVEMENIVGPHHTHPRGEVDLVLPLDGAPTFGGSAGPWVVCDPGSAHQPSIEGGRALVLYLLPGGEIDFG